MLYGTFSTHVLAHCNHWSRFGIRQLTDVSRCNLQRDLPCNWPRQRIRDWCASQIADGGPIEVAGINGINGIPEALDAAPQTRYWDNAVLVTMKVLEAAGLLTPDLPPASGVQD